jgi:hypothetical protein
MQDNSPIESQNSIQTEFIDNFDEETSSDQLNRWIENSLVCLTFLAILSLNEYVDFSPFFMIVPLIMSSLKQIVMTVVRRKAIVSSIGKCAFTCEVISTVCNFLFYFLLPILWGRVPTPTLTIPLGIEVLAKIVMRWMITSECFLFSELV